MVIKWPVKLKYVLALLNNIPKGGVSICNEDKERRDSSQVFLLALPMGLSFSSKTIHTSSIRRTCSSSYPSSSAAPRAEACPLVGRTERAREGLTSGKSVETLSAVIVPVVEIVVVALIVNGIAGAHRSGGSIKRRKEPCSCRGAALIITIVFVTPAWRGGQNWQLSCPYQPIINNKSRAVFF